MSQVTEQPQAQRELRPTSPLGGGPGPTNEAKPHVVADVLGWIFAPLLAHRRALLWMNLVYFGGLAVGALYTLVDPGAQRALLDAAGVSFTQVAPLSTLTNAYVQGQVLSAIGLTFLVNLLAGSLLYISVPSLVIPFGGLLVGIGRALLWGVLFAPTSGVWGVELLPHVGTLILEGEAYIVAMLGVWLWWWPVMTTPGGRMHAWWTGFKLQGRVYAAVATLLAVAAIYEALEVIFLVSRLAG